MTILELIEHLKQFPMSTQVAYDIYSEMSLIKPTDIFLVKGQPPRKDGWIHTYPREEDKETVEYLHFPGN